MLGYLLRVDNISSLLLSMVPTYDIKNLMCIAKEHHKLIIHSDVWRYKLLTLCWNSKSKIYKIIEIRVPCNFYSEFMEVFNRYALVHSMNFKLSIDNLVCMVSSRLIHTHHGSVHALQSIRDADWEYRFNANKVKVSERGEHFINLLFSLTIGRTLLIKFEGVLIIRNLRVGKLEEEAEDIYFRLVNKQNGITLNIVLYRQIVGNDDGGKLVYKVQFPYMTIDCSTLHELLLNANMKNKVVQLKYII
jgi:hypothetical protein